MVRALVFAAAILVVSGLSPPVKADTLSVRDAVVEISGTSTVKDWTCTGTAGIEVIDHSKADIPLPANFSGKVVAQVKVNVPVAKISCPDKQMTEHLRTALKFKANPEIIYLMQEADFTGNKSVVVLGELTIAGVTRQVKVNTSLERSEGKRMIRTAVDIDMRDFSVKPPSLMLGMLNVDPKVTVSFLIEVRPQWLAFAQIN